MQTFIRIAQGLSVAVLISTAFPLYAESAPVYDADSMQQQFESEQADPDLPPPPPPGQEGADISAQLPGGTVPGSLDQRVKRVEQQINNMQNSNSSARMDSLQTQVQTLRGQVEQLTHQLEVLQNQQKSQYADLDKRLSQEGVARPVSNAGAQPDTGELANDAPISATSPAMKPLRKPVKPTTEAAPTNQPNVAEEQQIYQTAYNLIKAKRYEDAVTTLQGMLKKYPSGQFASNAHYWLGELYGLMSKNDQALSEFDTVLKTYNDSPRAADAQLKIGLIYASESKWSDAKVAFRKVINRYPGTASARLAAEHLKQIKQAGN